MKFNYDKNTDSLTVIFRTEKVDDSEEIRPGVIVDFSEDGSILSLEILNASKKIETLNELTVDNRVYDIAV